MLRLMMTPALFALAATILEDLEAQRGHSDDDPDPDLSDEITYPTEDLQILAELCNASSGLNAETTTPANLRRSAYRPKLVRGLVYGLREMAKPATRGGR